MAETNINTLTIQWYFGRLSGSGGWPQDPHVSELINADLDFHVKSNQKAPGVFRLKHPIPVLPLKFLGAPSSSPQVVHFIQSTNTTKFPVLCSHRPQVESPS